MKNQVNMTLSKETNRASKTDPKKMEMYKLSNKEFKIILLRKFSELQENN